MYKAKLRMNFLLLQGGGKAKRVCPTLSICVVHNTAKTQQYTFSTYAQLLETTHQSRTFSKL